jgi:hypothetical protein
MNIYVDSKEYAKIAYEAYRVETGFVSLVTGDQLPDWEELPLSIQNAWEVAVDAIIDKLDESGWFDYC